MDFDFKDWPIERKALEDLNPAQYNPRVMNDKAFEGLGESIYRFGLLIPIVWNKRSRNIVGGHQRYRHLVEAGEVETDVVVVDLDDDDEVALNIALNNPRIRGSFTDGVVAQLDKVSGSLGDTFDELRLGSLKSQLSRKKPKTNGDDDPPPPPPPEPDLPEQVAVITCPECKSKWKMEDNEVIVDGRA
jgi:hypothetical protein